MDRQKQFFVSVVCADIPLLLLGPEYDRNKLAVGLLGLLTVVMWALFVYARSPLAHRRVVLPLLAVAAVTVAVAGSHAQSQPWSLVASAILALGVMATTRFASRTTRSAEALGLGLLTLTVIFASGAVRDLPIDLPLTWALLIPMAAAAVGAWLLIFRRASAGLTLFLFGPAFIACGITVLLSPFVGDPDMVAVGVFCIAAGGLSIGLGWCVARGVSANALLLPMAGGLLGVMIGSWFGALAITTVSGLFGVAAGALIAEQDRNYTRRICRATVCMAATFVLGSGHLVRLGQAPAAALAVLVGLALVWSANSVSRMSESEARSWV